jgi:hypothetical protein
MRTEKVKLAESMWTGEWMREPEIVERMEETWEATTPWNR